MTLISGFKYIQFHILVPTMGSQEMPKVPATPISFIQLWKGFSLNLVDLRRNSCQSKIGL
ncbi:hypothetical protein Hdeb2414_s0004g00134621 [Helianthus debilis subsp. tardiflorus]